MLIYTVKATITLILIIAAAEMAKRNTLLGGLIASIPLVSLLAIVWLYVDTRDTARIAVLSKDIFWLVLPSLVFFVCLPLLLNQGINFWFSLALSVMAMTGAYLLMLHILG